MVGNEKMTSIILQTNKKQCWDSERNAESDMQLICFEFWLLPHHHFKVNSLIIYYEI